MRKIVRAMGAYSKYRLYITCSQDRVECAKQILAEAVSGEMVLERVRCREREDRWMELEVQVSGEHLLDSWLAVFVTRLERERGIRGIEMRAVV